MSYLPSLPHDATLLALLHAYPAWVMRQGAVPERDERRSVPAVRTA
jgi:hypothetical protein